MTDKETVKKALEALDKYAPKKSKRLEHLVKNPKNNGGFAKIEYDEQFE